MERRNTEAVSAELMSPTPYCLTGDHQSLEDHTVTIRYRDNMLQERVSIDKLPEIIEDKVSFKKALKAQSSES